MKSIIKGMTLLLAGASFVACSKDVAFDENAQKEAKAQAELQQKFSAYDSEFVKAFGSIAPNHKWGFDKTRATETRGAVTNVPNDAWEILKILHLIKMVILEMQSGQDLKLVRVLLYVLLISRTIGCSISNGQR